MAAQVRHCSFKRDEDREAEQSADVTIKAWQGKSERTSMDNKGLVVLPGQDVVWNLEADRTASFKLLSEQTRNSVAVFEESIPAGFGTALHLHHNSDEAMCVLSGEFEFKIGDTVTRGGPGTWAFMPREIAHAWKKTASEPGRALVVA